MIVVGAVILLVVTAGSVDFLYASWIKPLRAKRIRAKYPFEPGPDRAVSSREMVVRSAWRYDSWYDRIISLICVIFVAIIWWVAITGTIPFM